MKGNINMFNKKAHLNSNSLNAAIDKLFDDIHDAEAGTEEFAAMVAQMDVLYKLREVDAKVNSGNSMSPDTKATIIANLLGILVIVGYEQKNVVTTKALSLLAKLH